MRYRVAAVVVGMILAAVTVGYWQARCEHDGAVGPIDTARAALEGRERVEIYNSFGPLEVKMDTTGAWARSAVPGSAMSASFTFKHALWPGMDALDLYFGAITVSFPYAEITMETMALPSRPGQFGFRARYGENFIGESWYDLPDEGYTYVEIPCSWQMDAPSLFQRHNTSPIGDKAATHAKECQAEDAWRVEAGDTGTITAGGFSLPFTVAGDTVTSGSMRFSIPGIDADDWSHELVGVKYAMSLENVSFCGQPVDMREITPQHWGSGGGQSGQTRDELWVEGVGSTLGFWCSAPFYNGAYVYNAWNGGTFNAPYSYDFSGLRIRYMDGREVPDNLVLYLTGIRTLNANGEDIGPLQTTYGGMKQMGRYTQKYGLWQPA